MYSYFLLLISAIVISLFDINWPIYLYICSFIVEWMTWKNRKFDCDTLVLCTNLNALILPDNYCIILINGLSLLYVIWKNGLINVLNKNKTWICVCLSFFLYGIIVSVPTQFSIIKILFSVLYLASLFICPILMNSLSIDKNSIKKHLRLLIFIEGIAIIVKLIFRFKEISQYNDLDWVVGTFGEFQSNILFLFCCFSSFFFLSEFIVNRKKSDLGMYLISIVIAFSTGSIAMTLMYITVSFVWFILNFSKKLVLKLLPIALSLIVLFVSVNPSWIYKDILHLTNPTYFVQRVSKIQTYEDTFINQIDDPIMYLFGTGLGNYSSRAALTGTGIYVDFYNKLFSPIISKPTKEYIYDKLVYVYANELGSLDTPFSSVISIKGELGLLGFIGIMVGLVYLLKQVNNQQKLVLLFFVTTLLIENHLEFSKVIYILLLILMSVKVDTGGVEKMKEKIIFVSGSTVGYGADLSMISAINELKKKYDCLVILPGKGRSTDLFEENNISYYCVPFKHWIHYDTSFVGKYIKPVAKLLVNIYALIKTINYLKRNEIKPLLIYSNSFTNYYSIILSKLTVAPYVQHIREFGKEDFNWHFDIGFENTCKLVNKSAKKVVAISESVLNTYKEYFDEKLIQIYNGVPDASKDSTLVFENETIRLVMTGRLSFEKGQIVLIEAIKLLKEKYPKLKITADLFGDGPDFEVLNEKVKEYSLDNYINFCGYQKIVDLSKYNIGVICSTSEGFGRVTVEYMAAKLPVLGANGGATPEILLDNETGYLFTVGSAVSLFEKLELLVFDNSKMKQMGENGYLRFKKYFSQDVYVKNIYNMCSQIIESKEGK